MSLGQSNVNPTESSGKWSVFADPEISVLADKVFVHILRYLINLIQYISSFKTIVHCKSTSIKRDD
jgi:hypothetical protein